MEIMTLLMFICLGIAIYINYYNIDKHLKEHTQK